MKKLYFDAFISGLIPIKALRQPRDRDLDLLGPVSWESDPGSHLVIEVQKSCPESRDGRPVPEEIRAYQKGEKRVVHRRNVVVKVSKAKTGFQYVRTATDEELNLKEGQ